MYSSLMVCVLICTCVGAYMRVLVLILDGWTTACTKLVQTSFVPGKDLRGRNVVLLQSLCHCMCMKCSTSLLTLEMMP